MFNEFKQVVVDQRLKSRFKNSYFDGLWDLPEHMKFNGQLVHYTLLRRVEQDNKLHEMWFCINDRPAFFGLKEFALITGLNCGRYFRDSKYVKAMEEGESFFKKIMKKKSVNAKRLLKFIRGGRLDKEDKFKCYLVWFVHCILLERDLSKIVDIETIKMVDNLSLFERYPWDKESFTLTLDYLKKWIDFSRQKKTFETKGVSSLAFYGFPWAFIVFGYKLLKFGYTKPFPRSTGEMMQSRHSTARVVHDDSSIKEALLEVAALEQGSINADEVMIPEVAAVVEKENLDEEKEGIVEKENGNENDNEFPNLDEFLNEVTQDIDKIQVEDENIKCLDNV
ncbi:uncharacterized protein LOC124889710 [Capsicum annuum]|uniref:uncharacterized protein LOC124889710 n=1 Tax=Capsicum annuum TaxID=4072 RepID=UPI001FB0A645|nr:uncharacterized protein LOC124889710 [Capsicum annuum]